MSPEPKINPDLRLAEAFGHYVERWAAEHRAPAAVCAMVRRAAVHLSTATSTGHVCVYLSGLAASLTAEDARVITPGELREALLESGLVGSPRSPGARPLILDGDNRLYLHRYFDYESRLARCLVQRRGRVSPAPGGLLPPNVVALLNALFPQPADAPAQADWQKIAVLTALLSILTIVSGGPGTGKTTALVKLLACLLEANPACRIALAAPTGKAAARITETIRQRSAQLPGELAALLPPTSSTVHRLLGVLPDGGFRHHAGNPLPIDVLIVDEASMLDLALAARLFEAVPPAARIILVGDKDQLAAVESGAVFAELSADPTLSAERIALLARLGGIEPAAIQTPRPAGSPGLTDSVVWLRQNYRFGSGSAIGRLAEEINAGDADAALTRLRAASDPALTWRNDGGAAPSRESLDVICRGYARYLDALRTRTPDPGAVTSAFGRFRTLCAVRDGTRGAVAINEAVSRFFRQQLDLEDRSDWYPGRPVIVLRNDYTLQLFNGDIGIVLPDAADHLMVYFPDAELGYRAIPPVRLPEHETAFAMTVHKAQGSEFDEVLVLLPAESNRVLTRELLYTGVTRARERVTVMGSAEVVAGAIRTATQRLSGLEARLLDARARLENHAH
jgi:exodeoxyribonuclease V alpha subunit